ncbi:MAG: antitoxin component YwqK of YwqJK toxin-antitoxin module, partial [Roseivirga sp.]
FSSGNYENGYPTGTWTFFDTKGRKVTEGELVQGVRTGVWKVFSRQGRVIKIEVYENGELIEEL